MTTIAARTKFPNDESVSANDLARLAGVSYRRVDYWDRGYVLQPDLWTAGGSGTKRGYSRWQVVAAAVLGFTGPVPAIVASVREWCRDESRGGVLTLEQKGPVSTTVDMDQLLDGIRSRLSADETFEL